MGWTNFIVISKLRLVVEVSRNVDDLLGYERRALDLLLEEDSEFDGFCEEPIIEDKRVNELTIADVSILFEAKKISRALKGIDCAKLLLYWLSWRDIEYEIINEYSFQEIEWQEKIKDFMILRLNDDTDS